MREFISALCESRKPSALQLNILKVQWVQSAASAFAAAAAGCRRSIDFRLKVTLNTVAGPFTFAGGAGCRPALSLSLAWQRQPPTFPKLVGCNPSCSAAPPPPLQRAAAFSTLSNLRRYAFSPLATGSAPLFSLSIPSVQERNGRDVWQVHRLLNLCTFCPHPSQGEIFELPFCVNIYSSWCNSFIL